MHRADPRHDRRPVLPAVPRTLYIYVNKAKVSDPAIKAFVDYYLSDSGIVDAVQQTGYVDLPSDQIESSRSTWTSASGGTGATGSS
jgi:ABC-type phosphate transport system, periplasmic component